MSTTFNPNLVYPNQYYFDFNSRSFWQKFSHEQQQYQRQWQQTKLLQL
ncbi:MULTISPECIES: hypothetical protein [Planktothrix]|nr:MULTISPECIES: hypothetical protein [Planktothrix]